MAKLRVYHADVVAPPVLRVYHADVTGSVSQTPVLRVFHADVTGTASVVLNPLPDQTVDPHILVPVTVTLAAGSAVPDTYVWRVVSGTNVAFIGSGASVSFQSPDTMPPGTSTTIGVTGLLSGVPSAEVTATYTILPQLSWSRVPGGQWIGSPWVVT